MIIYLLRKGTVEPIDFTELLSDGNTRLNLIDGTFFHYFKYQEEYTIKKVVIQSMWDVLFANPFFIFPMLIFIPIYFVLYGVSVVMFFSGNALTGFLGEEF